jgi:hypothetical protein
MKLWALFILLLFAADLYAQDRTVQGVVFDNATKERIALVNVRNLRNGRSVYNNLKAEFKILVQTGDMLVLNKMGYFADTLKVPANGDIAAYLKASSIMLKPVNVRDTVLSAQKRLEQTRRDFSKVYGSLSNRQLLSISPGAGAGLSIDAIWNMISRSGRNAAHLREIIEQDYKLNVIDQRFNRTLVQQVTGLKDQQLANFMARYRPSYYQVTTATDYEFISTIKANLKRFMRNPNYSAQNPFNTPE